MTNKAVIVQGINVTYKHIGKEDYISITDIACMRNPKEPKDVVKSWMRNRSTLEYLTLWENFYNPDFKGDEIDPLFALTGRNDFTMSPTRWISEFNAIGIITKQGKNGGTFAHQDIAFKFASWISAEFEFYLIKEFQRLKSQEQKALEWSAKRELAKINYHIHTDAIKENLVPNLSDEQLRYVYADEADLLNVALFGKTAADWRKENPSLKGNIRDYATIEQLLVIANMESYNAILIEQNIPQCERLLQLNNMAKSQLRVLQNINTKLLEESK
ncbi:KilA-N domain-containing protein [Pumilibacter muris]|uniref:KilA-N domain-containing protein n=1 Tax=Pumilibacter muris TaxID=2941510 RepID=UPI00203BABD8|nr:KilA-N domain-containing protein [Pumilibacter muris]